MVSFADFITLMFALFTVLYATSNQDLEKTQKFEESIKRFLIKAGAFGGTGEKVHQGEKFTTPIEPPIQTYNQATPLTQETFDEAEKFIEEAVTKEDREKYVKDINLDPLGVRLVVSGESIYAGQSTKFKPQALDFLDRLAGLLQKLGRRVLVEGHYPNTKIQVGQYPTSWEFAAARATSFVRFLIVRQKMAPELFVPVSYGSQRPMVGSKQMSDRLEIVILTEDIPL